MVSCQRLAVSNSCALTILPPPVWYSSAGVSAGMQPHHMPMQLTKASLAGPWLGCLQVQKTASNTNRTHTSAVLVQEILQSPAGQAHPAQRMVRTVHRAHAHMQKQPAQGVSTPRDPVQLCASAACLAQPRGTSCMPVLKHLNNSRLSSLTLQPGSAHQGPQAR